MMGEQAVAMGAIFLLGSYAVATLDDIIRMKASRSFLYIWILSTAVILYFQNAAGDPSLWLRVALGAVLSVVCKSGIIGLKLAWGDILAMLPAIALFPPLEMGVFLLLVFVIDRLVLRVFYAKLLRKRSYPFMPAITAAMLLTLLLFYSTRADALLEFLDGSAAEEPVKNLTRNGSVAP